MEIQEMKIQDEDSREERFWKFWKVLLTLLFDEAKLRNKYGREIKVWYW